MPHKHKRKAQHLRNGREADYDLAPNEVAKAITVGKKFTPSKSTSSFQQVKPASNNAATSNGTKSAGKKSKQSKLHDDTPRAFARLLQYQKLREQKKRSNSTSEVDKKRGNLASENDDSASNATSQRSKKRKRDETQASAPKAEPLRIQPSERLSEFAARVDQSLPLAGLAKRNRAAGKGIPGMRERQTKMEKRLQRMQAEWREVDAKLKEHEAEERDEQELEDAERGIFRDHDEEDVEGGKKKGKKKRRQRGGAKDDDEDPWAVLKTRRPASMGLHDVAQAPPSFVKAPTEKFKTWNGASVVVGDVPMASGSLRRREQLGSARRQIIDQYRGLAGSKRNRKS